MPISFRTIVGFALLMLVMLAISPLFAVDDAAPSLADEATSWLQGYLRIDTTNPPGNEARAAAYLAQILHSEGVATRLLVTPDGRTNLYARLAATEPESDTLILLHHMDVVAAGDGWTHDPLSAELSKGKIWGRGAIDAKSLGIAHLAAFINTKRSNRPRKRELIFLAVADEESGGQEGARWLLEEHAALISNNVAGVLNEGGSNRVISERLLWWGIEVAQKRPLWVRATAHGRGGHGSAYNPGSATHRLLVGLAEFVLEEPESRVTVETRQYFAAIAPFHSQGFRDVFGAEDLQTVQDRFRVALAGGSSRPVLMPGMMAFFQDTIQITSVQGSSETVNVVSEEASALIDIRLLPDTKTDDVLDRLRETLGRGVSVDVLLRSPITPSSSTETPIFEALRRTLGSEAPVIPALITGTTDSRYFRERGIPAYGFSPFVLSGEEARGIHGPNESIPLAKFTQGLATMIRVVEACTAL
jgi:acetylornithine deacetylase/succinyl-diaminopimelate desuccinylase-like protein